MATDVYSDDPRWQEASQWHMGRLFFTGQSPPVEFSVIQSPETWDDLPWDDLPLGCQPSIEDLPDDTALPLEEWTAKVDAFLAEWEANPDDHGHC